MGFGEKINALCPLEWRPQCIDYRTLKAYLKLPHHPETSSFPSHLENELAKVLTFIRSSLLVEADGEIQSLETKLEEISQNVSPGPGLSIAPVLELIHLKNVTMELISRKLKRIKLFVETNKSGFDSLVNKLLKRYEVGPFPETLSNASTHFVELAESVGKLGERLGDCFSTTETTLLMYEGIASLRKDVKKLTKAIQTDKAEDFEAQVSSIPPETRRATFPLALAHLCLRSRAQRCLMAVLKGTFGNCEVGEVLGFNVLHYVVMFGEADLIDEIEEPILESLYLSTSNFANTPNREGRTPLHLACKYGVTKALRVLLGLGADCSVVDMYGFSPLLYLRALFRSNEKLVDQLLAAPSLKTKPIALESGAYEFYSPVAVACRFDYTHLLRHLIEQDSAALEAYRSRYGYTALHMAAQSGSRGCVREILKAAPSLIDVEDRHNCQTALMLAATKGHLEIVKTLVERGADVRHKDASEWTAFTFAVYYGQIEVIRYFEQIVERFKSGGSLEGSLLLDQTLVVPQMPPAVPQSSSSLDPAGRVNVIRRPDALGSTKPSAVNSYGLKHSFNDLLFVTVHSIVADELALTESLPLLDHLAPISDPTLHNRKILMRAEHLYSLQLKVVHGTTTKKSDPVFLPSGDVEEFVFDFPPGQLLDNARSQELKLQIVLSVTDPFHLLQHQQHCHFELTDKHVSNLTVASATVGKLDLKNPKLDGFIFTAPLVNAGSDIVGNVEYSFLYIRRYTPPHLTEAAIAKDLSDWKFSSPFPIIGHRGSGAENATFAPKPKSQAPSKPSPKDTLVTTTEVSASTGDVPQQQAAPMASNIVKEPYRRVHLEENTLLSFEVAFKNGADFVEFDVQLTRDGLPIIYHDFLVREAPCRLGVEELTAPEFVDLRGKDGRKAMKKPTPAVTAGLPQPETANTTTTIPTLNPASKNTGSVSSLSPSLPRRRSFSGIDKLLSSDASDTEEGHGGGLGPSSSSSMPKFIRSQTTTLKEAFKRLPADLGFNIEFKYPLDEEIKEFDFVPFEMNNFVDAILDVVFKYAKSRPVFFSCFNADICHMLSIKQSVYPIFFLTSASFYADYRDKRLVSLKNAFKFCRSVGIRGIVTQCDPFIFSPELIPKIHTKGLLILTYGKLNNFPENVLLQRDAGLDAIIVDHVQNISKTIASPSSTSLNN